MGQSFNVKLGDLSLMDQFSISPRPCVIKTWGHILPLTFKTILIEFLIWRYGTIPPPFESRRQKKLPRH